MKKKIIRISVIIILWQFCSILFDIKTYIFPSPYAIIISVSQNYESLLINSISTFFEASIGIILAIIVGILCSIIFFEHEKIKEIFLPIIKMFQTIPLIIIAPLFGIWFGFGIFPKILLIPIICAFPIINILTTSFINTEQDKYDYLISIGATKPQLYQYLYFDNAYANLYDAIEIAITYSVVTALFSEYMGADLGLGVIINRAASSVDTPQIFAIVGCIMLLTLVLLQTNKIIFRRILK